MATAMPTNRYDGDVIYIIFFLEKISKDKKYKEQKKQEIVNATCALLNSNGGKLELRGDETKRNLGSTTILDSLIRTLEQSLISRFGPQITKSFINFEDKYERMIVISVRKALFLATIKYNLYLSTKAQVELIDNVRNALEIMDRRFVDQTVKLGAHHKIFFIDQNCLLRENEVRQLKHLKSDSSKRVTLADRMIGKSNKFSCYVSAFANHRGGHIYYGIDDRGIVCGQNTECISEIEKKVEKAIQKMIWPDTTGQPKRGEHWEIFFEPVLDEKSNPIPSTFVIVIFIAPCFGGVFTEEPQSYEMVEGKVERMSFATWKEKLQPVGLNKRKLEVPSTIKRISLSPTVNKRCVEVHEVLAELINNGEWKSFTRFARQIEQKYPYEPDVSLVGLSGEVMVNYRQGNIHEASVLVTQFEERFTQAEQPSVFEMLLLFLKAAVARVSGKTAASRDISTDALTKAERIEPGLFTTAVYLVAASTYDNCQNDARLSPDILCIKALEHLEYVEDAPVARSDMYHTAHIILAAYHLGYNLSGKVIKETIDKEGLQKAQASIMAVHQSVCEGNPLTEYGEIWFTLAQSFLYIRYLHPEKPEKQTKFLNAALQFTIKAEKLAKNSGLVEMISWAQFTNASLLRHLKQSKNLQKQHEGTLWH